MEIILRILNAATGQKTFCRAAFLFLRLTSGGGADKIQRLAEALTIKRGEGLPASKRRKTMAKEKKVEQITDMEQDFAQWFTDV
ncbi:MAG: hypothetical protein SOT16_03185, partial [Oscillospiraceae bacterium]|nr:hypothetical protein [Oscillospiraceae bacterium]